MALAASACNFSIEYCRFLHECEKGTPALEVGFLKITGLAFAVFLFLLLTCRTPAYAQAVTWTTNDVNSGSTPVFSFK